MTNGYFEFLCDMVRKDHSNFELLMRHLHKVEFYSLVPNDDNRGEDGLKLREIYLDEEGAKEGYGRQHKALEELPNGPCTVLEMLIGLSFRMENELEGQPGALKASKCFWIFIKNLDLGWCTNDEYVENASDEIINDKIGIFLDRRYGRNGIGGLFPLIRTRKDQRKVEIWYQMAEYLLENYDF